MSEDTNTTSLPRLDYMHAGLITGAHFAISSLLMLLFHVPAREWVICSALLLIVAAGSEFVEASLEVGAFHCGFPRFIAGLTNGCALLIFLFMFGVSP